MVIPLIWATSPAVITSRRSSSTLKRDSGIPSRAGSSQASALTSATSRGGKDGGAASARTILETGEPFLKEPLSPLAHDWARQIEDLGDLPVLKTISGKEHQFGAHNVAIR